MKSIDDYPAGWKILLEGATREQLSKIKEYLFMWHVEKYRRKIQPYFPYHSCPLFIETEELVKPFEAADLIFKADECTYYASNHPFYGYIFGLHNSIYEKALIKELLEIAVKEGIEKATPLVHAAFGKIK